MSAFGIRRLVYAFCHQEIVAAFSEPCHQIHSGINDAPCETASERSDHHVIVTPTAHVIVRAMISPKRISESRSTGSSIRSRIYHENPQTTRLIIPIRLVTAIGMPNCTMSAFDT